MDGKGQKIKFTLDNSW